jgi:hypothetical protein
MSTLTPSVDRVQVRGARTSALLRGPLPVWAALFVNVLTFSSLPTAVPIPGSIGQMIIQGALVLAVLLALLANPGGVIRPSLFLVLLWMLTKRATMTSMPRHGEFYCLR